MQNYKPDLIQLSTHTRINDKWFVHNTQLQNAVNNFPSDTKFRNFVDSYTHNRMDNELYQQCFLQVVTETVYNYPVTFFSEKTAKPLLNKRPFVIIGPVGSLEMIRSLGFRTFSDFWSEDYDNITDLETRILAVSDIIEWIANQTIDDLRLLCIRMQTVLNYNFAHYVNKFKNNELQKFGKSCIENLKPRYDSDSDCCPGDII